MTVEALDLLSLPQVAFQASVPPEIATKLALMQLAQNSGDWSGVLNHATQLLELILRRALERKFGDDVQERWKNLGGDGIKTEYDRASLGNLAVIAKKAGIIPEGDVLYDSAQIIAKIRVPQVHEKATAPPVEESALIAMRTVEIFVRHWYLVYPDRRIW